MRGRWKHLSGIIAAMAAVVYLLWPGLRAEDDGRLHLQYWLVSGMSDELPYHATEYMKSHPGVSIDCNLLPWAEHEKKVLTAILSGNPPDVIFLVTPVAKWASRYALMPLDSFIKRDKFDTSVFFPSLWQEIQHYGIPYAIPQYSNAYAFFYNKALFRQAGLDPEKPPVTWNDVLRINKKLLKKDGKGRITQMGFIPLYGNIQTSVLMAHEMNARLVSDNGSRVHLTDSGMVRAMQWIVDFYSENNFSDVAQFSASFGFADQHGFTSGKLGMMILDNTFAEQIKRYNPKLEYGVCAIPSFEGCPGYSQSGSWWMAIPRGAKHPEAAWDFIKYAVKKDIQVAEALHQKDFVLFPGNKQAASDTAFRRVQPGSEIFTKLLERSYSPALLPMAHDVFWREFVTAQDRAVHKLETPYNALKQAEHNIQRQLDQAIEYDEYVRSKWGKNGEAE